MSNELVIKLTNYYALSGGEFLIMSGKLHRVRHVFDEVIIRIDGTEYSCYDNACYTFPEIIHWPDIVPNLPNLEQLAREQYPEYFI